MEGGGRRDGAEGSGGEGGSQMNISISAQVRSGRWFQEVQIVPLFCLGMKIHFNLMDVTHIIAIILYK